jgi:hypothetical protein
VAEIAKSGTPSLATVGPDPGACKLPTLLAGEAIAAGDACYIKSDGLVWRSNGAAVAAAAKVNGFAVTKANAGEPITLMYHVILNYGAGLTPGASYFLSGTVLGGIADAASTGGTAPVGFAIDATRVFVTQSRY